MSRGQERTPGNRQSFSDFSRQQPAGTFCSKQENAEGWPYFSAFCPSKDQDLLSAGGRCQRAPGDRAAEKLVLLCYCSPSPGCMGMSAPAGQH